MIRLGRKIRQNENEFLLVTETDINGRVSNQVLKEYLRIIEMAEQILRLQIYRVGRLYIITGFVPCVVAYILTTTNVQGLVKVRSTEILGSVGHMVFPKD